MMMKTALGRRGLVELTLYEDFGTTFSVRGLGLQCALEKITSF